jgi:hypothetical protein
MASVRMTNDLRDAIHNRAMEAFNLAKPEPQPSTWLTDRLRDAILTSAPYKALKEQFERQRHYDFKSFGGYGGALQQEDISHVNLHSHTGFTGTTAGQNVSLSFEFVPQIKVYRTRSWGATDFTFEELTKDQQRELGPKCLELAVEIRDRYLARQDYSTKIRNLVNECTSLKQMLMAWPAGESFVPDENKRRMYTKVTRIERAEKVKRDVQFDDASINEVVLTAKLVGGN